MAKITTNRFFSATKPSSFYPLFCISFFHARRSIPFRSLGTSFDPQPSTPKSHFVVVFFIIHIPSDSSPPRCSSFPIASSTTISQRVFFVSSSAYWRGIGPTRRTFGLLFRVKLNILDFEQLIVSLISFYHIIHSFNHSFLPPSFLLSLLPSLPPSLLPSFPPSFLPSFLSSILLPFLPSFFYLFIDLFTYFVSSSRFDRRSLPSTAFLHGPTSNFSQHPNFASAENLIPAHGFGAHYGPRSLSGPPGLGSGSHGFVGTHDLGPHGLGGSNVVVPRDPSAMSSIGHHDISSSTNYGENLYTCLFVRWLLFRCVLASIYEGLSVCPSVRPSVCPSVSI